jgi:hypothetical protein
MSLTPQRRLAVDAASVSIFRSAAAGNKLSIMKGMGGANKPRID